MYTNMSESHEHNQEYGFQPLIKIKKDDIIYNIKYNEIFVNNKINKTVCILYGMEYKIK